MYNLLSPPVFYDRGVQVSRFAWDLRDAYIYVSRGSHEINNRLRRVVNDRVRHPEFYSIFAAPSFKRLPRKFLRSRRETDYLVS